MSPIGRIGCTKHAWGCIKHVTNRHRTVRWPEAQWIEHTIGFRAPTNSLVSMHAMHAWALARYSMPHGVQRAAGGRAGREGGGGMGDSGAKLPESMSHHNIGVAVPLAPAGRGAVDVDKGPLGVLQVARVGQRLALPAPRELVRRPSDRKRPSAPSKRPSAPSKHGQRGVWGVPSMGTKHGHHMEHGCGVVRLVCGYFCGCCSVVVRGVLFGVA